MRIVKWLSLFCAIGFAGCSLYPLPDDVSSFSTEQIVRHARCEIRSAIIDYMIEKGVFSPSATEQQIDALVTAALSRAKANRRLSDVDQEIVRLANVAIVYTFDFNITENNKADGGASFKLPFTTPKIFDLNAKASIDLTRQGQRQFTTGDRWGDLLTQPERCRNGWPQHKNIVYPLDGTIGVGRVVKTFIDIADQGGAKDSFVDTLIFTTLVSADATAAVKLEAVPHSFRLVSASAGLSGWRKDMHKMVISLVFPRPGQFEASAGIQRASGVVNAPFQRPPDWRARYNLCVADARQREDTFSTLRLDAPEVYCITFADNFAPQYGQGATQRAATVRSLPAAAPLRSAPAGLRPNRL
jgi:hypothetical protein